MYGKNLTVASIGAYDVLNTDPQEGIDYAYYNWKQLAGTVSISQKEMLQNRGDSAVIDLVDAKMQQLELSLKDELNTELYQATPGDNDITNLPYICATSATVGNISQTTYTWWAAQYDSTSEAISLSRINQYYLKATQGSDHPDVAVTTNTIYGTLWNLLQPQQRFVNSTAAKAGFTENLMVNGMTIFPDPSCTSGYFYMLNSKYLKWRPHTACGQGFITEGVQKPYNQLVQVTKVWWMGNLTCNNCRMQAALSGKS